MKNYAEMSWQTMGRCGRLKCKSREHLYTKRPLCAICIDELHSTEGICITIASPIIHEGKIIAYLSNSVSSKLFGRLSLQIMLFAQTIVLMIMVMGDFYGVWFI